ncbi:MAG: choice-of-anchor tandem repeat NxxGxxAF-containing protein [Nitrososphaerales archaeon]
MIYRYQKVVIVSITITVALGIMITAFLVQDNVLADPQLVVVITTNDRFAALDKKFSFFGQPTFNDKGDIIFSASIEDDSSPQGIFKSSPNGVVSKLVGSGDKTPLGGSFSTVVTPSANNNNEIFFLGLVNGGSSPQGIFKSSNGVISKVVAVGDATPLAGSFRELAFPTLSANNSGDFLFFNRSEQPPSPQGIFKSSNGVISKVVVEGDPTPIGETFRNIRYGIRPMNDQGDIVFTSYVPGGSSPQGIFKSSNGVISKVVLQGDLNSNGEAFSQFDPPSINNQGDIVFFGGNTGIPSSKGVYNVSGGTISKIISVGDGTPIGGTYYHMDTVSINDKGDIVFFGFIKDGKSDQGIFRISKNQTSQTILGETTPIGGSFSGMRIPIINNNGEVVFSSYVKDEKGTEGIFFMNPADSKLKLGS